MSGPLKRVCTKFKAQIALTNSTGRDLSVASLGGDTLSNISNCKSPDSRLSPKS